jgi:hypothetical protein
MNKTVYLLCSLSLILSCKTGGKGDRIFEYPLREVPYYSIKVTGGLWKMRMDSCIKNTIWDNLAQLEASGRIDNEKCIGGRWANLRRSHELYNLGHMIEAAVAHYEATGTPIFLDIAVKTGDLIVRTQYIFRKNLNCFQDHKPVLEQKETTGHAVWACYMYAGMADIGAMTGNTEAYVLPNLTAYSETCGAVANILWNFTLGKHYKDARYFDVPERTLYNAYLPSFSIHGTGYLYTNPLADRGQTTRSDWFDPPCCPTNICRTTPSVPGYIYLTDDDNLYINLFIESESKIDFGGRALNGYQDTEYPWNGAVKISLGLDKPSSFTIRIRVPGWAREEAIPLGLYRYPDRINKPVSIKVNGEEQAVSLDKGYAVIQKKWKTY